MITASFRRNKDGIAAFQISGHSGSGAAGSDVVCAAVTSAVRLVECTVNEIYRAEATVHIDAENASIVLSLPDGLEENPAQSCRSLLHGLMVYFYQLQEEYKDYIRVTEV